MTTEELRARQLELFTAMIDGKQIQFQAPSCITWKDIDTTNSILWLLTEKDIKHIRIKPEPRKVWLGWPIQSRAGWKDYCLRHAELKREDLGAGYKWQLVEEQV